MVRPRRAYKRWFWPMWLKATAIGLVVSAVFLAFIYTGTVHGKTIEKTVVIPQPGPTWTSYVPEMPNECRDMLERADTLYDMSMSSDQATLKAATLAAEGARERNAGKLIDAGREIERAQDWLPKLRDARKKFLDQYRKCAEA